MKDIHLIQNGKIYLKVPYDEKEIVKQIPGRHWHKKTKLWSVPYDEDTVSLVNSLLGIKVKPPEIMRIANNDRKPADNLILNNLYEHQKKSISVARKTKYFADLSEPGTGKTLVQIELMLERDEWPVLVVCPKSIMEPVWEKQISEAMDLYHIQILNHGSAKVKEILKQYSKSDFPQKNKFVGIINYEMVPLVIDELLKIKWKSIILDESTKLKSPQAKRSKAVMKLRDTAKYRSIMTGTLAPNGLQDSFNQFKFVQPKILGESFYAFRQRYFTPGGYLNYEWFPKPDATNNFKNKIKGISVQHHKRECLDLPPLIEEIRKVEMSARQKDLYDKMKDECIVWLNENDAVTAPFVITKIMKLRQISSGFIYFDDKTYPISSNNPKDTAMLEILEQLGNEKCIIFAHFNSTIIHIADILKDQCVIFYGSEKSTALDLFENETQILVANPASAGHGLNLEFCSNIIYYENDFNLENFEQSWQRIERIGQKNKMTVYHLLTKNTIENYIYKKLKTKQNLNKSLNIEELKGAL